MMRHAVQVARAPTGRGGAIVHVIAMGELLASIIEAHGGRLSAAAASPVGTRIQFTLPTARPVG
jgi:hypothetical protein